MIFVKVNLKKFITKELLYYTWIDLKAKRRYFFYYFDLFLLDPLSPSWFCRTSSLLKNESYQFRTAIILSRKNHSSKKIILGLIKSKILENALSFLFLLHLSGTIYLKSINLTKCLCL
jgi:hypothetical protein